MAQLSFAVKVDKCVGSCNTLNDLSNRICLPNKTWKHGYREK